MEVKKAKALNLIVVWDVVENADPLSPEEVGVREEAKEEYRKCTLFFLFFFDK